MNGEAIEPRRNPRLVGHAAAEAGFLAAHRAGRLHHAWLITGPEGVGKATLAYRIARFLLAERGEEPALFGGLLAAEPEPMRATLQMDSEHPVFRRVAAGSHPDLQVLERAVDDRGRLRSEIVVADVRRLGEFLHRTPAEGGWRVVIVDAVDELNTEGANALLKALEEPPRRAILLLVSHNPGRLLATIRSRCHRLPLLPLPAAAMREVLDELAPALDPDEREVLIEVADGSPGLAVRLARDGGIAVLAELVRLARTLPALDLAMLHEFADRVLPGRQEAPYRMLGYLLPWWLARLIRWRSGAAPGRELIADEGAAVARLAAAGAVEGWLDARERILRLFERAEAVHLDRRQVVIDSFLLLQGAAR